jgi:hypothetical protein
MDAIEIPEVNAICLQNAVLCAECEVISDSPHDTCRVCGSRSLMSLSCVLGGTLPAQRAQLVDAWESRSERPGCSLEFRVPHNRARRAVA